MIKDELFKTYFYFKLYLQISSSFDEHLRFFKILKSRFEKNKTVLIPLEDACLKHL